MKRRILVSAVLAWAMMSALLCPYRAEAAMAAGAEATDGEMEEVHLAVIKSDAMWTPNAMRTMSRDGRISGDGVRLRKTPSFSGIPLELMCIGEIVMVKERINRDWLKVKRYKTGTIGYVNDDYVAMLS